jgi:hypothetical protein
MAGLNGTKRHAFGTRPVARTEISGPERRIRRWRPQSLDIAFAVIAAVGLAAAYPLFR